MTLPSFRVPLASDVSLELATRAHSGTSHTPERRGESEVAGYVETIAAFNAKLAAAADTDNRLIEAVAQSERYRENHLKKQNEVWHSRSRLMSAMISGPANYPVRRQEKAFRAFEKKAGEFYNWQERALAACIKAIRAIDAAPVEKAPGAKSGTEEVCIGAVKIVTNHDLERIQILFDGKPDAEVIALLKGAAWKWSPRNSAWQRMITNNSMYSARRIAEAVAKKAKAEAPAAPAVLWCDACQRVESDPLFQDTETCSVCGGLVGAAEGE